MKPFLILHSMLFQGPDPSPTPPAQTPSFWDANSGDLIVGLLLLVACILIAKPLEALGKWLWARLRAAFEAAGFGFEKRYLNALTGQHKWLKLIGIYNRADLNPPRLQNVFISLRLASSGVGDGPRFPWDRLFDAQDKTPLVLLGQPGAGKTTLIDYLILVFSGHIAHPLRDRLGKPLPLFARLRDLGAPGSAALLDVLQCEASTGLKRVPRGYFERRLKDGHCVVLLDGLDEVLDPAAHDRAVAEIQHFANEYPNNRLLVTCRVAGWRNQLPGWRVYHVQDFDSDDIHRFISAWYGEVLRTAAVNALGPKPADADARTAEQRSAADARIETERLWEALQHNEGLLRIARTPLILSLITLVHKTRSDLPKGRARLYRECLEILLEKWDMEDKRLKEANAPSLKDKMLALQHVAVYFLREGQVEQESGGLESLLAPLLPDFNTPGLTAEGLLRHITERSGVLVETRIGVYGFAHRALADYLAASFLAEQREDAELLGHAAEERWREVILIAAGLVSKERAETLIKALIERSGENAASLALAGWSLAEDVQISAGLRRQVKERLQAGLQQADDPAAFSALVEALMLADRAAASDWMRAALTGRDDSLRRRTLDLLPELPPASALSFAPLLARLTGDARETPALRAAAALALAKLRFGEQAPDSAVWDALQAARQPANPEAVKAAATWAWCELGRCASLGLVKVPAGEFWLGSDPARDRDAGDDEAPQHRLYLPTFYIARAPVTVAEWRAYCQATGHKPFYSDSLKGMDDHPVCDVTWYESLEYARYHGFGLPSEAEWEKAARGELDARIYPWGDSWQPGRANTDEYWQASAGGRLRRLFRQQVSGQTTPVGKFSPLGDSPYGCADMIGNVWEWTRSHFKPYPYDPADGREDLQAGNEVPRVLRGGSFNHGSRVVRCSYRRGNSPYLHLIYNGFRVGVVAHIIAAGNAA